MKNRVRQFGLLLLLGCLPAAAWALPEELREKDVLYFDDNLPQPLVVPLAKAVYLHADRGLNSPRVALPEGAQVRIVGMTPQGFYIEGKRGNTPASGWVAPGDVTVDPKVLQQAEAAQQHRDRVKQAIEDKRVLEGMTFDDVRASQGKPETISFRMEQGQRIDTWRYITYERVPQTEYYRGPYGQLLQRTVFVKVPAGKLTIDFRAGLVTGIENHTKTSIRGTPDPTIPGSQ